MVGTMDQAATSLIYEEWEKSKLIQRIKELEARIPINSKTDAPMQAPEASKEYGPASCRTNKRPEKRPKPFDFDKYPSRYIAIKFGYVGWHYSGLAWSGPAVPTVETELFKALQKTRLIQDPDTCRYSRCGRTDRGVSSTGQVSAFIARSNVNPEDRLETGGRGYSLNEKGHSRGEELDYVQMLNGVLPPSIRVRAWAPVPDDFHARFSCRARHYRYFFTDLREELDIEAMRKAAGYFIGEHDFRNFCKLDVQMQITNFKRTMISAEIVPYEGVPPNDMSRMWMFKLKGTAFLWHQVRCMMSILFLVGQGLEKPEIVADLLDMEKYSTKPLYEIAHDIPLVLYDCDFDGIEWRYPEKSGFQEKMMANLFGAWHEHKLRETVTGLLCSTFARGEITLQEKPKGQVVVNKGSGVGQGQRHYYAIAKRRRLEAFEVTNERYRKSAKYEEKQLKFEARRMEKEENGAHDIMEDV